MAVTDTLHWQAVGLNLQNASLSPGKMKLCIGDLFHLN